MNDLSFLQGLTFVDSFFPSGGYAHSFGLEAAVYEGIVKNGKDLKIYLSQLLQGGVGLSDGIASDIAHRATVMLEVGKVVEVARQLDAMKTCYKLREASRQMGWQVLRIGAQKLKHPVVKTMHGLAESGQIPAHHAVAMGVVLAACGWPERAAVEAALYQTVVGWVSAGLRLLPLGQEEGQQIIHGLLPQISQMGADVEGANIEMMICWAPLHEIRSMRHAKMEVRLFRS